MKISVAYIINIPTIVNEIFSNLLTANMMTM